MKYVDLRNKLKQEHKVRVENYTKEKRENLSSHSDYLEVRIKHLAYCMLRGRKFEELEAKWKHPDSSVNLYVKKKSEELYGEYLGMLDA